MKNKWWNGEKDIVKLEKKWSLYVSSVKTIIIKQLLFKATIIDSFISAYRATIIDLFISNYVFYYIFYSVLYYYYRTNIILWEQPL